jgi:hypothetical protein
MTWEELRLSQLVAWSEKCEPLEKMRLYLSTMQVTRFLLWEGTDNMKIPIFMDVMQIKQNRIAEEILIIWNITYYFYWDCRIETVTKS